MHACMTHYGWLAGSLHASVQNRSAESSPPQKIRPPNVQWGPKPQPERHRVVPRGGGRLHVWSSAFHFRLRPRLSVSARLPRLKPRRVFSGSAHKAGDGDGDGFYPFPFRFFCAPSVSPVTRELVPPTWQHRCPGG
jgi:hypothetical protein